MGIVLRQSLKGTVVSYLGVLIGTVNVLWFFPKFLQPEQIGLIRLLQDFPLLLGSFIQLGAANLADRFYPYFKTEDRKDQGFFALLLLYPLSGFVIFLVLFFSLYKFWVSFYETKSPLLVEYFVYMVPLAFFILYSSILESYARVNMRIVVPAIIRDIGIRLLFSIIIVLYFLKIFNWNMFIILFVGMYAVALLVLFFYLRQLRPLFWNLNLKFLDKKLLKDIFSFASYIIPGAAGSLIAAKIDTIMLGSTEGLASTGIYSIAFFVGAVVEMPRRALSQITIPVLSQAWKRNDLDMVDTLYKKTTLNLLIISLYIFVGIWISVDELLSIIPNSEIYKGGKYVIFFVGIAKLIEMGTGINTEILVSSKHYRFNLFAMLCLCVITILANLYLIPRFNIIGVGISLAFSLFIYNLMKSGYIWYKLKLQPYRASSAYVLAVAAVSYALLQLIPFKGSSLESLIGIVLAKSTLLTIIYFGFIYIFKLSEDLNGLIHSVIKKIRFYI